MKSPFVLSLLLVIWLALFAYSFFSVAGVEPTGDSFLRGMNRVTLFLKWHGSAFAFALASLFLGWRAQSKQRRWLSRLPTLAHLLLLLGTLGTAIYLYQSEKAALLEDQVPPLTTTP